MKVSVSYLNVKKRDVADVLEMLDTTEADFIHVDVKDGKYVKKKANLYRFVKDIGKYTRKRLDIHFMVRKPHKMVDYYALLDAYCMTFHIDIKSDLNELIDRCHMYGIKVGLALNPDQDIEMLDPYLDKIDLVLVMSVVPGMGGQEFMPEVLPKIKKLREKFKKEKRDILISVDGGVNLENKKELKNADIIVSGSCVTNSDDYAKTINELRK